MEDRQKKIGKTNCHDTTSRTGRPGQDCEDGAARRIGLPSQDYLDETARAEQKERKVRKEQIEQDSWNRRAITTQLEWDSQNSIGTTRLPERTARNRVASTGLLK